MGLLITKDNHCSNAAAAMTCSHGACPQLMGGLARFIENAMHACALSVENPVSPYQPEHCGSWLYL